MSTELLLLIVSTVCFGCLTLERRIAWLAHISGVCLIIMVALLFSLTGVIPATHSVYDFFMGPVIPVAIALLVFGLDLREVVRLPKSLLIIYVIGIIGSMLGSILGGLVAAEALGMEDSAKLAAQLAASYIGGGENAAAMHQILSIKNELFVAAFAVDNIATSIWMVATIFFAQSAVKDNFTSTRDGMNFDGHPTTVVDVFMSISLGLFVWLSSKFVAQHLTMFHPVLLLSLFALAVGQMPGIRERIQPAYLVGTILFSPFFFSIGAISDLSQIMSLSWAVIFMPLFVVFFHGVLIYGLGALLKVPSLETSLASQSLIGGPATAVALAQAKRWKSGISMGLVVGLVGYATANYFAMFVYKATKVVIQVFYPV